MFRGTDFSLCIPAQQHRLKSVPLAFLFVKLAQETASGVETKTKVLGNGSANI